MNDEFENALAWFSAAPGRWVDSAKNDLSAAADWIWEVLQGDFNDKQSTPQVLTGTVISMIPFVDQICDVRDICANSKKINSEPDNSWHWISLVLTLIGLLPVLGSLFKGCAKVMFAGIRKAGKVGRMATGIERAIDVAVTHLRKFLARPEVIKTLKGIKMDNVYKNLAKELRKIARGLSKAKLLKVFDEVIEAANELLELVKKWGSKGLAGKAVDLIRLLAETRKKADLKIAEILKPMQDILEQLARRLDIEADMAHRVHLNTVNPHAFNKLDEAGEIAAIGKKKPNWVDVRPDLPHTPLTAGRTPPDARWTSTAVDPKRGKHVLDNAHATFSTIRAIEIPPGTKLYRVVDPTSADNSICWMSETDFFKLKSKNDWRRNYAVWASWNSNGEFVTYVVPPGKPLCVWEGVTASQRLKGTDFVLEGGARQIVIDPAHMARSQISRRQSTNWDYDDLGVSNNLVGVPVLKNKVF